MPCPSDESLTRLVEGSLGDAERLVLQEHVESCQSCRKVVAGLAAARSSLDATFSPPRDPASAPQTNEASLEPGATVGRYTVLERLGAGGMAVVYAAFDPQLDRRVALKVMHTDAFGSQADQARERLLREGRTLARLVHPNVVTAYEVGTFGDQLFLAMEYVRARDVTHWLAEKPRTPEEILGVYRQAGRGLAAAHAASIVHRDVKPQNILVGDDGRARMADFGLARSFEGLDASPSATPAGPIDLTRTGALVGTPLYMAPEQLRGEKASERTDQYGFCVALFEALHGVRPFSGTTIPALLADVVKGQLPPLKPSCPLWVRAVLERGLKANPAERFESMKALLEALEPPVPKLRRRLTAAVVVLAAAGLVAGGGLQLRARAQLCRGAEVKLAGVWDDGVRAKVKAAFLATQQPFAPRAFESVQQTLDAYAAGWTRAHTSVCEATRVRGEQSEELLDRRMRCLGRRLGELGAFSGLLAAADAQLVEHADDALAKLSPLDACTGATASLEPLPPPALRTRIDGLDQQLDRAQALLLAGKNADAKTLCEEVLKAAREAGYQPLEARALHKLAVNILEEDPKRAKALFLDAIVLAKKNGLSGVEAEAWSFTLYATELSDPKAAEEVERLRRIADAAAVAYGPEAAYLRCDNLAAAGRSWQKAGEYQKAEALHREAFACAEGLKGDHQMRLVFTLANLEVALSDQGKLEEALALNRKSLAITRAVKGEVHPDTAIELNNLGTRLGSLGKKDEAVDALQQALAIREKTLPPGHPGIAATLNNLGRQLLDADRFVDAETYFRRALPLFEKAKGAESFEAAIGHGNLARALSGQKRFDVAFEEVSKTVAIFEKVLGPEHPVLAIALTDAAEIQLSRGKAKEAVGLLERAVKIRTAKPGSPVDLAKIRFALGRARYEASPKDRPAALELVKSVVPELEKGAEASKPALEKTRAWLTAHPR